MDIEGFKKTVFKLIIQIYPTLIFFSISKNNYLAVLTSISFLLFCSQTYQSRILQQLDQQQHGQPTSVSAAQFDRRASSGSDQTANDLGHHHQAHRVGLLHTPDHFKVFGPDRSYI